MKDLRNKLFVGVLLAVCVFVAFGLYADLSSVAAYLSAFPLILILPVLLLTLFNYALRWSKWDYYLRLVGVSNLPRSNSIVIFVSGFVLALSPGKIAELLKAAAVRSIDGTSVTRTMPTIIAERITDGLAMLVLGAVGFGGILLSSQDAYADLQQYVPLYLLITGALIVGIVALQFKRLILWFVGHTERLPLVGRFSGAIGELYESSYELFQPRPLLVAVALGVVSWSGECVGFYIILRGLGLTASWLLLWQATFILALASVIGGASGLPGGLGAAEVTIVGMIQLLITGASSPSFATTAAILARISTLWFGVLLGLATAFLFRRILFGETGTMELDDSIPAENAESYS